MKCHGEKGEFENIFLLYVSDHRIFFISYLEAPPSLEVLTWDSRELSRHSLTSSTSHLKLMD